MKSLQRKNIAEISPMGEGGESFGAKVAIGRVDIADVTTQHALGFRSTS